MFPELLFKGWHWLIELTPSKTGNSREKETHAARDIAIKEKRKLRPHADATLNSRMLNFKNSVKF